MRAAWLIREQLGRLEPGQPRTPVIQVSLGGGRAQQRLFPANEFCVDRLGLLQGRRGAGGKIPVERSQLACEHSLRPAIEHQVMHREQQDMLGVGEPEESGAQQRRARQIEGFPGLLFEDFL